MISIWQSFLFFVTFSAESDKTFIINLGTPKKSHKKMKKTLHNQKNRCIIMQNKILNIHNDINFMKDRIERKEE